MTSHTPHEQQILDLLTSQQDRTQGDLLTNSDCRNYAELNAALKSLQDKGLVEYHFPDGVLRYRLKSPGLPDREKPGGLFWQFPK